MTGPKPPTLEIVKPELLQLTLNANQAFAVWRALQCYQDICSASTLLAKPDNALLSANEVHTLLDAHMRKKLGYVEDTTGESPGHQYDFYGQWTEGTCNVYRDRARGFFVCRGCKLMMRHAAGREHTDSSYETRHEMILHLERHLSEGHVVHLETFERLRAEIAAGGK